MWEFSFRLMHWLQSVGSGARECWRKESALLLRRYRVPALLAVGLEGFWGLVISAVALPILSVVRGSDGLPLDSAMQAFRVRAFAAHATSSRRLCARCDRDCLHSA